MAALSGCVKRVRHPHGQLRSLGGRPGSPLRNALVHHEIEGQRIALRTGVRFTRDRTPASPSLMLCNGHSIDQNVTRFYPCPLRHSRCRKDLLVAEPASATRTTRSKRLLEILGDRPGYPSINPVAAQNRWAIPRKPKSPTPNAENVLQDDFDQTWFFFLSNSVTIK